MNLRDTITTSVLCLAQASAPSVSTAQERPNASNGAEVNTAPPLSSGTLPTIPVPRSIHSTVSQAPLVSHPSNRITPLVRAIANAVPTAVNISGSRRVLAKDSTPQNARYTTVNGLGSGILLDARGYILTNHHVIHELSDIKVQTSSNHTYRAHRVYSHVTRDLAIIKIDPDQSSPSSFQPAKIGKSSDIMLGETVIAIGNPYGYGHSVSRGIVSSLNRTVQVSDDLTYHNLIQVDVGINPGNSGGPLINLDGEIIGVTTAVRSESENIAFALPIDDVLEVVKDRIP